MPGPIATYRARRSIFATAPTNGTGNGTSPSRPGSLREKVVYAESLGLVSFLPYRTTADDSPYKRQQLYRKMFSHDAVKAPLLSKVFSVSQLEFTTQPASDNPRDAEIADFVKYQFTTAIRGRFRQVAETILLPALLLGHSVCEKVWDENLWPRGRFKGKRFLKAIKAKEDAELVTDKFRNITAVRGRDAEGNLKEFDPKSFIIFRHLQLFEDEGTSDLDSVYDLVWKLDTIEKLHNIHLDKYTSPATVAQYKAGTETVNADGTPGKPIQDVLEAHLETFKSRNWMVVPEDVQISALQMATRGEAEFLAKCEELRQRIALALVGAYLQMMAQGHVGEMRGDSDSASSMAELFVWALAENLGGVISTQAVPDIIDYNYMGADYCECSLGGVNYGDQNQQMDLVLKAQQAGFKPSKRAVSRIVGIQEAADPSDELTPPTAAGAMPPGGGAAQDFFSELGRLGLTFAWDESKHPRADNQPPSSAKFSFAETDRTEVGGLAGIDGKRAEELLAEAKSQGAAALARITRAAVERLGTGVMTADTLFTDDELQQLADTIAATIAPADLLGRARIRERAVAAERRAGRKDFAEPVAFHTFDESGPLEPMTPKRALEYFRSLIPQIAVDAGAWTAGVLRRAFTIAGVVSESILGRIKEVITGRLETGQKIREAVREVDDLLDEAGLTERNPQRSEMIIRTNMMDSYNTGAEEEGLEVADTFPVYRISNPDDGRSRPHHAARNGKYFRNAAGSTFSDVRGRDVGEIVNCRCVPIYLDKFEWRELQAAGATIEESW